jgi:hypothetical protein
MSTRDREERPLKERLAHEADQLREKAKLLPAGARRDALLKRASRLDEASQLLSSS